VLSDARLKIAGEGNKKKQKGCRRPGGGKKAEGGEKKKNLVGLERQVGDKPGGKKSRIARGQTCLTIVDGLRPTKSQTPKD